MAGSVPSTAEQKPGGLEVISCRSSRYRPVKACPRNNLEEEPIRAHIRRRSTPECMELPAQRTEERSVFGQIAPGTEAVTRDLKQTDAD
jgi:hypothetical protein